MKILLREHCGEQYVWKTAKYNNGYFHVYGEPINQTSIVSIINDNRKNYTQCSCCGQVFRRGDNRFQAHKENAIKPETCFDCSHMVVDNEITKKAKFEMDAFGNFTRKLEQDVYLTCSKSGIWSYDSITSNSAIHRCKKRQCADAEEIEISDFFIKNPGVFDDIITIDSLLDNGYDVSINDRYAADSEDIEYDEEYTIGVIFNRLGIVDKFYVYYEGDRYYIYYSKRYDELFTSKSEGYAIWNVLGMPTEMRNEIKAKIVKLYR